MYETQDCDGKIPKPSELLVDCVKRANKASELLKIHKPKRDEILRKQDEEAVRTDFPSEKIIAEPTNSIQLSGTALIEQCLSKIKVLERTIELATEIIKITT